MWSPFRATYETPNRSTGLFGIVGLVYHVAADYRLWAKNPAELYASNVEGTRNLLERR